MQEVDSKITKSTKIAEGCKDISGNNECNSRRRSLDTSDLTNSSSGNTDGRPMENKDEIAQSELHARVSPSRSSDCESTNKDQKSAIPKNDLIPTNSLQSDYLENLNDSAKVGENKNNFNDKNHDSIVGICEKNQETQLRVLDYVRKSSTFSPIHTHKNIKATPSTEKYSKSFHWVAQHHKKIGFRHICLLLVVLAYTLLGASIFYLIESDYEKNLVATRIVALDTAIEKIATQIENAINDPQTEVNISTMETLVKKAYITLLNQESAYKGSTYYKASDPENNFKWTFGSAFFFSMNVFTTTGYGSIAPESVAGKSCVIWYGLIFVPLTLVVIRDLGQWTLVHMTKIYARILIKYRTARGRTETKEDELIELPLKLSVVIMISYLMFTSLFVYEYDTLSGPPDTGMDFFHAFYFSFISMSTIGLGDIMPNNVTFAPIITIMFFFGMPILKVVNRVTYITVENGVFGTLTVLENRLDSCWTGVQPNDAETQAVSPRPSLRSRSISNRYNADEESSSDEDGSRPNEFLNNFTIRSIATFMRSNSDVYGGDFGRVVLRRGDLLPHNNSDTVRSAASTIRSAGPR